MKTNAQNDMSGFNPDLSSLDKFFNPAKDGIFPASNNINWWFYHLKANKPELVIYNSAGRFRVNAVTHSLQQYISGALGKPVSITVAKTPQQSNSFDCGVFVVIQAAAIMKKEALKSADEVERNGRHTIRDMLLSLLENPMSSRLSYS